ncbi:phosphonatase-like hydrolase [Curtobacterium sp. MCBD17_028]|nr:phosphonatase-like hydrolase [Curtobacterium sp. MCBD17_028]
MTPAPTTTTSYRSGRPPEAVEAVSCRSGVVVSTARSCPRAPASQDRPRRRSPTVHPGPVAFDCRSRSRRRRVAPLPYALPVISAVVFDMAGTTIDDRGAVYRALRSAVEDAGAPVADADLQRWMGTDKEEAITALLELGGVQPTPSIVSATFRAFRATLDDLYRADPPVPMAGVEAALADLRARGVRVALTTGFDEPVVGSLLASLGWTVGRGPAHTVDAVVTTSDVRAGRPAPYMIHHAMELLGVEDVRQVLAAGDTVVDVRAARNAGVVAVGVCTGALSRAELEAEPHDHVLDGVADVPALLAGREARVGVA